MQKKRITANGIDFAYLEQGEGPLALLLHGFPEAPSMYRHLMPVLADAGYRAVAPAMRGFAPTQVPPDGSMRIADLIADANSLHEELGGDTNAVIIGHDWGGFATWGAAAHAPDRWSKVVVADVPPVRFYDRKARRSRPDPQKQPLLLLPDGHSGPDRACERLRLPRLALGALERIRPGLRLQRGPEGGQEDSLRAPENLRSGLGLYRDNFNSATFGTDQWEMGAVLADLSTQPTLYLHGQ